ncbi:hypothetical protein QQF64_020584 [Cirrhinus molitorella]|uniref:Fibronectin type-III domain-containing protein n=1 Tax=Cirrhinus molitorella TaxID=172907 RepID=A0ABR3LD17_9TELE
MTVSVFTVTSKSAVLRWSKYEGALSYRVTASLRNSQVPVVFASFGQNTIMGSVNSLNPNTAYTFRVEALDSHMNMLTDATMDGTTAPDVPAIVIASSKQSQSITVEFTSVSGAISYILRAETSDGSFFTEISVPSSPGTVTNLQPYTDYTLSVMSVNSAGRSQPSISVEAKTVLPAPQFNTSSPSNSSILVKWDPLNHAVLYSLSISKDGSFSQTLLNTTETQVLFTELEAGTKYCIKGNALSPENIPGDDFSVCQFTLPPAPQSIQLVVTSTPDAGIVVTWNPTQGAEQYVALSLSGQNCSSSSNSCVLVPLSCGETKSVTVIAINQAGNSVPSYPVQIISFPCPPQPIWVEELVPGNCSVKWSAVPHAEYYTTFIKSDDGIEGMCNSTELYCQFHCHCGYSYIMSVFAHNQAGPSPPGPLVNHTTLPCCPENSTVSAASWETLLMEWSPVRGADLYETRAVEANEVILCNDTAPRCALSDLTCNTRYSVVVIPCNDVSGCNFTCRPQTHETAPCMPKITGVSQINMPSSSVLVNWTSDNTAANYTVNVIGLVGETHVCHSNGTSCLVSNLPCGSEYEVSAIALTSAGESMPSYTIPLETAPCCPDNLTVSQVTQAMTNVTWSTANGAQTYIASLSSSRGNAQCHTMETGCVMGCITCGTNYTVSLEAISHTGHKAECTYHGFSASQCCPSGIRLYRGTNNTLIVRWRSSSVLTRYTAEVTGSVKTHTCSPEPGSYTCTVSEIVCGQVYSVVVAPLNPDGTKVQFCNSRLYSALGRVTSVSVSYTCASASAVVSWTGVFGATTYRATAVSHSGTVLSCTSSTTECQIRNLACGENYMVHVTALSDNCESTGNATTSFQTVPCAPSDLMLYRECSSNVIVFSWSPNNYSAYYYARGVDSTGKVMECMTTERSCFFTDTTCGRLYNFTVSGSSSSVREQCSTATSSMIQIQTAPCQATNMRSSTDCKTGLLTSSWEGADGALRYTVEAFGNRGNQSHYICNSLTQSCTISDINCGESLTMIITAADNECSSVVSLGEIGQTAPCPPQNVSAVKDCSSDSISLTWEYSSGAFHYFATAVDEFGNAHTCTTTETRCKISGVNCGSKYTASVIAGNNCNSSVSDSISVETAPCPPGSVEALLDCQENQALVSWLGTRSMISFTATMEDQLGGLLSCSTTANSCRIPNLKCGQVYDISVTYHDGICPSMPSHAIQMRSVPCGPTNIHAEVQCPSGVLSLSWDRTEEAEGYIATIVSETSGELVYCNSTLPSCNVSNLQCGDSYSVKVRSYNGSCLSMPSSPLVVREVPCVPTNVTARRTCGSSTVEVSWSASRGAQSYVALAVGNDGHRTKCSSNTTTCSIPDLHCSSVYSISLVAVDGNCSSRESQSVTLHTVPCAPTDVQSTLTCSTNSVTLSWTASLNAVSYRGRALGGDGHIVTCDATTPGCQLNGLHCGQEYVFVVTASDGSCESPGSAVNRHKTAPCAPQNVLTFLDCASNSLNISWAPGITNLNYTVLARTTGAVLSCTTMNSSCIITGLECGKNYTAVVTANNGECQGPEYVTRAIQTVPCMPTSVHANVECVSNTVRASWSSAAGALSYTGVLTGPGHYNESCLTSGLSCTFRGLSCAQTYMLNVISYDSQCKSPVSPDVSVTTAPCDPQSVTAVLKCDSRTVNVSWHAAAGASTYTVLAQTQNQSIPPSSCRTLATSCDLTQIQCGEVFNVTVLADDGTCNSSARASTTLESAPCPPTMRPPSVNCSTNTALVSWVKDPDAVSVRVNATSVLGHTASCSSSTNNCSLDALLCGQTYSVYGVAQGPQCESAPSAPFSIVTAPCTPAQVSANYSCGTSTELSWTDSLGRDSFYVLAQTNGHSDSCSTIQTHCSINSLRCGSLYNVSVDAISGHCNSSHAAHTQLQTAPCAPKNVTVKLQCLNNTAVVSWEGSPGAVGYNVTAVGQDGDNKHSTVTGTNCQLPNLHCGQTYDIVITPFSKTCTGFPTAPYTFNAGSCPASNVQVSVQCNGNVGIVNWIAAKNAESYIATATGTNGHTHTCTSSSTNCTFTDLHCGEDYTVKVATVERGCQSPPSTPASLRSAICPPSNLAGHTNCATDDISITWDPSPKSGVTYFLFIHQVDGLNSTFTTTQTSHVLTGLHCGMSFIVQAAAQDSTCTSPYGSPTQIYTAPCPPSSLTAAASCGTNRVTISWLNSTGAYSYTASVVGNNGQTVSCTSNTTSCSVKVECGLAYTATVVSTVGLCNSTANNSIHFKSADCLPSNVKAQLDCNSDMLTVEWDPSANNPDSYTALAIGTDGTQLSCNTISTSCTIQNLRCGRTYSIAVTTSNVNCGVLEGSDYQIMTAPCQPQSPTVQLQCSTNIATVTWDNDGADQFDMVTALNFTGGVTVCNSTNRSCTFAQLRCGESYSLNVVGFNGNCTSAPSESFNLNTAPCVPTFVVATTNCDTSITTITWDSASGASSYTVHAVSSWGHNSTCTSTDTTCSFSDLDCGQNYTITVTAEDDNCMSLTSAPIAVTTVPCPHTDLQATLDCSTDSALISWTPGKGTLIYNATAEGLDVNQKVSCSTAGSACNVTNLHCGSRYQVSVSGEGLTCASPMDDWIALKSAPCPPTQVSIQSSCDSDTVSVSWETSQGSVSYMAVAETSGGHRVTCDTAQLTCDITGLLCGQTYQIYVSGVDGNCIGSKSEVRILETAPCVPQNVQTILKCQATVLNVTWQQTGQAHHYHTTVKSSDGQVLGCDSNTTFCQFPNILCGQTYSATVVAYSKTCNSSQSSVQHVTSAPCPPDAIFAILDCELNTVSVSWDSSVDGVLYIAQAFFSNNNNNDYYTCNTTETSCDITVACGMDYNVTVVPLRDGCTGENSPVEYVTAAPCNPLMLDVEMDCLSDSAWLTWEESAGAELYIATATDSEGQVYQCNSTESQCTVEQLQCGRFYNVSVTASNSQCDSSVSNTLQTETAPCPPENVITSVGCDTGTVTVLWDESVGALSYTATLERTDGETTCCTASSTSCEVASLPCGQMYVLTVMAEGRICNSSQSLEVIVRSIPCIPESLVSTTSCSDNVVTMSWVSNEAGELYTVEAFSVDGLFSDSCSGFGQSCNLTSLMCGVPYTATVKAQDSICTSPSSQGAPIRTVPCVPDQVTADVSCQGNDLSVFWEESAGADLYTAVLEDSNGHFTSCQSMNHTTCTINRLACGQTYRVSVIASDGYCDSLPSAVIDVHSAPCMPQNIQALVDCQPGTAVLSWQSGTGAMQYTATATAVSESGHVLSCESNDTNCELTGLACGESYNITVLAEGDTCSSTATMSGHLNTGPCEPQNTEVQYSLSIGQLSWDRSKGASTYTAQAVTDLGSVLSCSTSDTSCALLNMSCSQTYDITVIAHNNVCQGTAVSASTYLYTEPCPPQNVQTHLNCASNVGTVSWEESLGAVAYMAFLEGRNGHSLSCYTTSSSCSVTGMICGTVYNTQVRAIGETYNSTDSETVLFTSAPCPPVSSSVTVDVNCENATALFSWAWSSGAASYELSAISNNGYIASCISQENFCNISDLVCGQTYTVRLTSINDECQVIQETGVTFQTRPCAPLHVNVDLQCKPNTAIVTWEQRADVLYYLVSATLSTGEADAFCNSTTDSCEMKGLQCGVEYTFTVTAYSSHCHSDVSSTVHITTEPCQPTQPTVLGSCDNNTVLLNWSHSKGASSYTVHITSNLGYADSFQTSESTLTVELLCGQTYTFTTTGENDVCDSIPSNPAHFTTAPCVPYHIKTYAECENNIGAVSWAGSDGADIYTAIAIGQDNHTHVCITNTTYCVWEGLHCGEIYFVQVVASTQICNSMPSDGTVIHMAPCVPQNLVSSFDCNMKVGSLTWEASENAQLYLVSAESDSGHRMELSTNTTSAQFSEFNCGQSYYLAVQAVGNVCRSHPSNVSVLQSEPCTPTSVFGFTDCISNIATVSWEPAEGAEYYTATVHGPDGPLGTCMSWSSSCGMPKLSCGETYNVSVIASSRHCNSTPSALSNLNSVPCVPTGVSVVLDCATAEAHVTWNASMGALYYVAYAWSSDFNFMSCESSGPLTQCTLRDLICGDTYTIQMIAVGDECSSLPSQAENFRTVPCAPEVTASHLDCYTDSVVLQWSPTDGSISYTADAQTPEGLVSTCSSNSTNCELRGLACGQTYNVTMVSYDGHCHSMPGTALAVASVPCPPENVELNLLCSSNSAHVQWNAGAGAESYEVYAISTDSQMTGCDSTNTSCVMPNLECGSIYNVSVLAIGHHCNVSRSEITKLHSVPCVPNHIQANLSCGSGVVDVSWQPSKGAFSYTAVAQGSGGFESSCNSSSTTCKFSNLLCGLTYSISVTGSDNVCSSTPSHSVQLDTVPCEPHGIVAQMECVSHTGVVSWEQGEHVAFYLVQASSSDGHQVYCNSPTTSCRLDSLHCGQAYNLTLTAQDSHCNSQNAFSQLHSVPCAPTNVQASLVCLSNSASVTWQSASGALNYQAEGITVDGTHTAYCNNSMPHCNLEHLLCGQTYNVSVLSMDHTCSSEESLFTQVHTAPCPPQTIDVKVSCSAGSMTVTWPANPDAESFHVRAETSGGSFLSCDSTSTSCSFSGLPCGQSYSVTVASIRGGCQSQPSTAVNVSSAPCVPQGETGNLDCVTNSAWVTWLQAKGAESYSVLAVEKSGSNSSCSGPEQHCNVPDLLCGATYTFHVTAINSFCKSAPGNAFQIQTAPCALTSITAHTDCYSSHITVNWQLNDGSSFYVATAEGHDQSFLICNSTGTSCDLSGVKCGMQYTIIISASSDKCSSLRSPPLKIHTAPCAPQNITVNPVCDSNGMTATWSPSLVAESYSLTASGRDGDVRTCRSTANNCTLLHLHCGQIYDVSIIASAGNCTSQSSQQVTFYTVPCEPQNMIVEVQCDTRTATLSWIEGQGSLQYFTKAQTMDGHTLLCDTTSTSCSIHGLTCGTLYNFTALASDGTCNSSLTVPIQRGAVPCPPATVRVRTHVMVDATLIRVSWNFVNCPDVTYLIQVTGNIQDSAQSLMDVSSYWTDINYFEFPVPCSTSYSVTVFAQNSAGISRPSQAVTGVTVPCPPKNVKFTGDSSSATVAWESSVLTKGYRVYHLSSDGRVPVCLTSNLSCEVSGLQASNVAVTAWNNAGESFASRVATGQTSNRRKRNVEFARIYASLTPEELAVPEVKVAVTLQSIQVEWSRVTGAESYTLIVYEDTEEQPKEVVSVYRTEIATVTDLEPATLYCIIVSAKNDNIQSSYSQPVCVTTDASK